MKVLVTQSCLTLCDPIWTVTHQTPLSIELSRQEYWSGLPFSSPGDLPNLRIEPRSPTLQADSLPSEPQRNPKVALKYLQLPDYPLLPLHLEKNTQKCLLFSYQCQLLPHCSPETKLHRGIPADMSVLILIWPFGCVLSTLPLPSMAHTLHSLFLPSWLCLSLLFWLLLSPALTIGVASAPVLALPLADSTLSTDNLIHSYGLIYHRMSMSPLSPAQIASELQTRSLLNYHTSTLLNTTKVEVLTFPSKVCFLTHVSHCNIWHLCTFISSPNPPQPDTPLPVLPHATFKGYLGAVRSLHIYCTILAQASSISLSLSF